MDPSETKPSSVAHGVIQQAMSALTAVQHDEGSLDPRLQFALHLLHQYLDLKLDEPSGGAAAGSGQKPLAADGAVEPARERRPGLCYLPAVHLVRHLRRLLADAASPPIGTRAAVGRVNRDLRAYARAGLEPRSGDHGIGKLLLVATSRECRLGKEYGSGSPTRYLCIFTTLVEPVVGHSSILPLFANLRTLQITIPYHSEFEHAIDITHLAPPLIACPFLATFRLTRGFLTELHTFDGANWASFECVVAGLEDMELLPHLALSDWASLSRMFTAIGDRLRNWVVTGIELIGTVPPGACPNLERLELIDGKHLMGEPVDADGLHIEFCSQIGRIAPAIRILVSVDSPRYPRTCSTPHALPTVEELYLDSESLDDSYDDEDENDSDDDAQYSECVETRFLSFVALRGSHLRVLDVSFSAWPTPDFVYRLARYAPELAR
ncbi:hypothetical protein BDK51DRAFT_52437, partial [Blyttiomyces helicus]